MISACGSRLAKTAALGCRSFCLSEPATGCGTPPARGRSLAPAQHSVCWSPSSNKRQPGMAIHTSAQATAQDLPQIGAAPVSL